MKYIIATFGIVVYYIVFATVVTSKPPSVTCSVGGVEHICSSSSSIQVSWMLKFKHRGSCSQFKYRIKSIQKDTNTTTYNTVSLGLETFRIQGLQKDKSYKIVFMQYLSDNITPVKGSYKHLKTLTHEAGTVQSLTVENITTNSSYVRWNYPAKKSQCVSYFVYELCKVDDGGDSTSCDSQPVKSNIKYLDNLEPCTKYTVTVFAVDIDNVYSSQSATEIFITMSIDPGPCHVKIIEITNELMSVSWSEPRSMQCVSGYKVSISDESQNFTSEETVTRFNKMFTFTDLKQCSHYYITVEPSTVSRANLIESSETDGVTTMNDNVVVEDFSMTTTWTSLKLEWRLPSTYMSCEPMYALRVCDPEVCREPVMTNTPQYNLTDLTPCTEYNVTVAVRVSPYRFSKTATVAKLTTAKEPMSSEDWQFLHRETSNTIFLQWQTPNISRRCADGYIVRTLQNGRTIHQSRIDYSLTNYTIPNLKSCHNYSVELSVIDHSDVAILNYESVNVTTQISDDAKITDLEVNDASPNYLSFVWFLDPVINNCQSHYLVNLSSMNRLSFSFRTSESNFTWEGSVCSLKSASVQIEKSGILVGKPAHIHLWEIFRNISLFTLDVNHDESNTAVWVQLKSPKLVCGDGLHYNISWFYDNKTIITSPLSEAQKSVRVDGLFLCSQYTAVVSIWNGSVKLHTFNQSTTTNYEEPKLKLDVKSIHRGLNVSWQTTKMSTTYCLSFMKATVKYGITPVEEKNVTASSTVMINNLVPCRSYTIELRGLTILGTTVNMVSHQTEVLPESMPAPLKPVINNLTNHSAELIYEAVYTEPNDCLVTKFLVQCQYSSNLSNIYYPEDLKSTTTKITTNKLIPNTKYKCVAFVTNRGGTCNGSEIYFTTLEGLPSEPKNLRVEVVSRTEVQITWNPPAFTHGKLTNYTVIVDYQSLLYHQAPGCVPPPSQPKQASVDSDTTQLVLTDLLAYMTFRVRIMAATKAGYGPLSSPITSATPIAGSDPVKHLNINVTQNMTIISWEPPCYTGGPLTGFHISLNGSRFGQHTANYSWVMTLKERLRNNYSVINTTTNLTAEAVYVVTVTPVGQNKTYGLFESRNFTVLPRIPAPASPRAALPEVTVSSSTAVITFHSDMFPDTEGTIRYCSIIIAESFPDPPTQGWLENGIWPNVSTWAEVISQSPTPPYQATPMYWEPFREMSKNPFAVIQFELGEETCSETDIKTYCNGPLKPKTVYGLRIRAFTSTGYRDSTTITFTTESVSSMKGTVVILTFVIIIVMVTSALVYLLTSGQIKRLKEKEIDMRENEPSVKGDDNISMARKGLSLPGFLMHADVILSSKECLEAEYKNLENLSQENKFTQIIAKLPQNKIKNRYTNISPYDWNRVVLEGDENNDYINASHIKFQEDTSVHYIACQGPPTSQCGNFWRMIIQYQVSVIVMLCLPVEKRDMCSVYFPKLGEELSFGDITAQCTNEEEFTNYVLRSIVAKKGHEKREVKQFHFLMWPDRSVPSSPLMIVELGKAVRQETKNKGSVICVHCSAGVGRTGTFITIDYLSRMINKSWNCKINILDTVLKLRDQRCKMVQTQMQYKYIYECLKCTIESDKSFKSQEHKSVMPLNSEMVQMEELS